MTGHDLRFDALEERVETIREGTVTAIGYAAHASRGHVDLRKQIADLTRRVERLEAADEARDRIARLEGAMSDGVAVTDPLAYWRSGHGAKGA